MKCEKCRKQADGLIGGYKVQAGDVWCVECVRAAGINVPHVLTVRQVGEGVNDRAEWLLKRAAEKKARLEEFLAKRRAAKNAS